MLNCIGDLHAPLATGSKQFLKSTDVLRSRDHENLAQTSQHQRREWVIHHRFVINRQQLLADGLGGRIKPCTRAPSKNDPLHYFPSATPECHKLPSEASRAA